MKRFFKILILFFTQSLLSTLPQYNGQGPRNVYYVSCDGNNLLSNIPTSSNQDNRYLPFVALRDAYENKGYNFHITLPNKIDSTFFENTYAIFWQNMPHMHEIRQFSNVLDRLVLIIMEPPHVMPTNFDPSYTQYFRKIFTWNDADIDNKKFFKYHYVESSLKMIEDIVPFQEKKLCTLIGGNKLFPHPNELYSKRTEAINFFERNAPTSFDLYGVGWNQGQFKTYKGVTKTKTEVLRKYKFSICYENIAETKGYITEKIFGSFIAGCVPVYWGPSNINDYIPANCFIDKRKYPDFNQLYRYLSEMGEKEYNEYLDNIRIFLASDAAHKFSIEYFVETLTEVQCL